MPYSRFLPFSILGGLLWICSMVLAGYFLGGVIENALGIKLEDHIEKVVIVVVFLSLAAADHRISETSVSAKKEAGLSGTACTLT